ncbi:MAG: GNAT family protein [Mycobacteriales bacterium]|nr:GNAT family protein [Mycobacteriales bacterium]
MRTPEPVVLTGDRVRLEPLGPEHVEDLFAAAQDDRVWRWLPALRPRTVEDVVTLVDAAEADPDRLAFAVVVDSRAVGSTSYLDIDVALGGLEIGWTWYAVEQWASRTNPQCKRLLLGHAFDDVGAGRVLLKTDALNARSQAAIRRLGAEYDGTLRHQRRRPDGTVRDTAYFSILAAEWPAVRAGLDERLAP